LRYARSHTGIVLLQDEDQVMFFSRLKISQKLPLIITTMAAVSAGVAAYVCERQAEHAIVEAESNKLVALEESRTTALNNYLSGIKEDLSAMAYSDHVRQALYDFSDGWGGLSVNQTQRLQKLYIEDNPNPAGKKEEMDAAADDSLYTQNHAKYHPWFKHFLRQRSYYDIFLFGQCCLHSV
jgi:methyl-accepting chemotaxis protein